MTPLLRTVEVSAPLDLRRTLKPTGFGGATGRWTDGGWWRAAWTADGAVTMRIEPVSDGVRCMAWGPGAARALEEAPALLGLGDDDTGFRPSSGPLRDLWARHRGVRLPRTGQILEILLPTILGQRVTVEAAMRSWQAIVRRFGEPAPGPGPVRLPPLPEVLASIGYAALHPLGVERSRADRLLRACRHARRLEEAAAMPPADAYRRLTALPGIGPWTAAKVLTVALGDPDAVPIGDLHLPHAVSWLLAREPRADDDRMLELLEPWRGHRGRVVRLIEVGNAWGPRRGPRREPPLLD